MSDLPEQVAQTIRSKNLLRRGQAILVAVSGGVDSMALLHVLHGLAEKFHWHLVIAHFNHRLRGAESDADEGLVQKTAAQLGLQFVPGGGNVRQHQRAQKVSLEMAGRALRHNFLGGVAERMQIPSVALAHHADDQVELFFLRLFRGAGGEGLGGMKWISPALFHRNVQLVRPLLGLTKADLLAYAEREEIPFREDASNRSLDMLRNRIRHELVPLLIQRFQPAVLLRLLRSMEIIGPEAEYLRQSAERWIANQRRVRFERLHPAVQRQCLCLQLAQLYVAPDFDLVEHLRHYSNRPITVSPGCTVYRDEAGWLYRKEISADKFDVNETSVDLGVDCGKRVFDGVGITWQIQAVRGSFRKAQQRPGLEFFDADKIGRLIRLRHWRAGDRFQPIGMARGMKLQDFFTNSKIPRARRRELIVATTASDEIFWIEGLRIGERFKLDKGIQRRLKWEWQRVA